jgi:hypothetical protein
MHDLEGIGIVAAGKHHQLASAKVADRTRKARAKYLFLDPSILGIEKDGPTVERDTVANSGKSGRQHRHGPALVADMIMNMTNAVSS